MVKPRHILVVAALVSLGAASVAIAAPPAASGRPVLALRGGNLDGALKELARQAGVQILYPPSLVDGLRGRRVTATHSLDQAFSTLLRGTGLRAIEVADRAYVLERVPASPPSPSSVARGAEHDPFELASVMVTGTHIPRSGIDLVEPAPMTRITREQIEASGHLTLFELLREQPGMIGHHPVDVAVEGRSGGQQPFASAATTSLYGLGPRATLFLVNGQRIANYGLISADLGGLTDLASIPLSIVERVEIIHGGASAIYGADAMAGVVNIILRKGEAPATLVGRYGATDSGDAAQRQATFLFGHEFAGGGDLFLTVDHYRNEGLSGGERDWRSQDLRRLRLGDWRFQLGYRDDDGDLLRLSCPGLQGRDARVCAFDPPRYATLEPSIERTSLYTYLRQPVGDATEWRTSLRLGRNRQQLVRAPFHASVAVPDTHPDWIPGMARLDYAFLDIGTIRNRTLTDVASLSTGLAGWWGDWEWQGNIAHHRNEVESRIDGLVRETVFTDAVLGNRYRFAGVPNPPALLAEISPGVTTRGTSTLDQLQLGVSGPWFQLPGGEAKLAAGFEFLRHGLVHRPDALMLEHDLALSPQKIQVHEHRDSVAGYLETRLPVLDRLQLDLAARLDHHEGYGSRWSPRLGGKWTVSDSVILRGTAATGYRPPSLFELRRPDADEDVVFVPETPGLAPCRFRFRLAAGTVVCGVVFGSAENPDLRPETSSSQTLGVVWTPLERMSLSLDYFRIARRDEILPGSALDDLAAFPGSLVRDDSGRLVGINERFENVGRSDLRGLEFEGHYNVQVGRGELDLRLSAHILERHERTRYPGAPTVDGAGYLTPMHGQLGTIGWKRGAWSTTLHWRRVGSRRVHQPDEPCPQANVDAGRCVTPGFSVFDLDVAYAGVEHWRIGFNMRNLFGHTPVDYRIDHAGYDFAQDDPRGRYYLLSAAYRF